MGFLSRLMGHSRVRRTCRRWGATRDEGHDFVWKPEAACSISRTNLFHVKVDSDMKRILATLMLLCIMLMLGGCGSGINSINTAENAAIYTESPLAGYEKQINRRYAAIETPWLAVRTDDTEIIQILGVSEDLSQTPFSAQLLEQIRTLILVNVTMEYEDYRSTSTGTVVRGSTEVAEIHYYAVDHAAGTLQPYAGSDSVTNELPEKKTGGAPHYVVTDSQALTEIRKREASGIAPLHETDYFSVDTDGVLWFTSSTKKSIDKIVIPDTVKQINKFKFAGITNTRATEVWIPPTVEKIEDGAFCKFGEQFLLVVEPGSYAEQYAINQGIDYQNGSGLED